MLALYEATQRPAPTVEPPAADREAPAPRRTSFASPGHRAAFAAGMVKRGSTQAGIAWLLGG